MCWVLSDFCELSSSCHLEHAGMPAPKYIANLAFETSPLLSVGWSDVDETKCRNSRENKGCCKLGPPDQCNWRRDCCNHGTGNLITVYGRHKYKDPDKV
jgi:hypothetical protein